MLGGIGCIPKLTTEQACPLSARSDGESGRGRLSSLWLVILWACMLQIELRGSFTVVRTLETMSQLIENDDATEANSAISD